MARRLILCAALLLSSCASIPTRAKRDLIGISRDDMLACAGVPDRKEAIFDGEVLEWRQDQAVEGPLNIKTPFSFELDIGGRGMCHLVARMRHGLVAQIEYTGPSSTLSGPYAACRPLVVACERLVRK